MKTVREVFEDKMKQVEEVTGRKVKLDLMMCCGPNDAEVIYERMFACFQMGMNFGRYGETS